MSGALRQFTLTWLLVFTCLVTGASAGIYVVRPSAGSTCRGGEECLLQWLDDGTSPLLTSMGICSVGLYTGKQKLIQPLGAVDVSAQRSISFTTDPKAGPNADNYYIALVSQSLKINGSSATAWSPFFRLTNMEGSLASPLPSSAFSLSLQPSSSAPFSTVTVTIGTLSTSSPPLSTTSKAPSSATPSSHSSSSSDSAATPTPSIVTSVSASSTVTSQSSLQSPTPTTLSIPPTFTSVDVVPETSSRFVTSVLSSSSPVQTATSANSSANGALRMGFGISLSPLLVITTTLLLISSFV